MMIFLVVRSKLSVCIYLDYIKIQVRERYMKSKIDKKIVILKVSVHTGKSKSFSTFVIK